MADHNIITEQITRRKLQEIAERQVEVAAGQRLIDVLPHLQTFATKTVPQGYKVIVDVMINAEVEEV